MTFFARKSRGEILEWAGWALLFLYVVAGMIYSATLVAGTRFPDEVEYLAISHNVLQGIGYSLDGETLTAGRAPGYPYFLSAIQFLGGGFFSFRALQFLLLGLTFLAATRLATDRKMSSGLLVVTGLAAGYPVIFYLAGTLYSQTLSEFLFVLAMGLTLAGPRRLALDLAAGLAFGALILTVPSFLLIMIVTLACAWFLNLLRPRNIAGIFLAAALVMSVWITRNVVYLHHFIPVASNSGMNFLTANNPHAIVYKGVDTEAMGVYWLTVKGYGWDEFQANAYYWNIALAYLREHPGHAFVQYLERTLNYFNFMNGYAPFNGEELSVWKQAVVAVSYLALLALLGWRLADRKRYPVSSREKLLLTVYVLSAFTSAIFLTRIRLRVPFDFLIIAVVALYLSRRIEDWLAPDKAKNSSSKSTPSVPSP
jgi:hypothetical protein